MLKFLPALLICFTVATLARAEDKPAPKEPTTAELEADLQKARDAKDVKKVIELCDKLIKSDKDNELDRTKSKYEILLELKDIPAAMLVAKRLMTLQKDDADQLNELAWKMVDPEAPLEKADLKVAEEIAQLAVKVSEGNSGPILDTLARVYATQGNLEKAIEFQTKAVAKANEGDEKDTLQKSLDEFKAKKAEKEKKPDEKK